MDITAIKDFLVNIIESIGYPGIFIAMVLESCLIPLPSEVTMTLAGALAAEGLMNIHLASWIGAVANVTGSIAAYWLGRKIPEPAIIKFIQKWGKFLLINVHEYAKAKEWIRKYGSFVSFFSRLLPGVRTVVSLPAGVAAIPLGPFVVWTFIGSLLWCYVLVIAGYTLGENWESIENVFSKFQIVIVVAGVAAVMLYVFSHLRQRGGSEGIS